MKQVHVSMAIRRGAVWRTVAVAAVLGCAGALLGCSGGAEEAILLEPASAAGSNPFTDTTQVAAVDEFPTDIVAVGADVVDDADPATADGGVEIEGTTAGLYGGSNERAVCDPAKLIDFLADNDEKAAAWASVFDIPVDAIPSFIEGLTPTVLLADTKVTNHGFRDGRATSFQAVLEAGTAVLVDDRGVPRVKCNCGNPLEPPRIAEGVSYEGDRWGGFDAERLVVVRPGAPVEELVVVDLTTGERVTLPVGSVTGGDGWVVAQQDPDGLDSTILTSADGATWRRVGTIPGVTVEGLVHGPMGWVAVGRSAQTSTPLAGSVVYTSEDLATWTKTAELEGLVYDVAVGDGRLVAVGDAPGGFVSEAGLVFSTPLVHVSTNGTDWTTDNDALGEAGTAIGNRQPVGAVEYEDGVGFVLGAVHAADDSESDPFFLELFTSPDGTSWTTVGLSANGEGSAMSAGGERGVGTEVALAAGDGALVQAAQPWVPPADPEGMGDAPRVPEPIVIYDPAGKVESVPCGLCNPDGEAVEGTPFADQPVSEMAFGDGAFLAVANSDDAATVFRSGDARTWDEVGALEGPARGLAFGPTGSTSASTSEPAPATTTPPPAPTPTAAAPPSTSPPARQLGDEPVYSETAASGSGCNPGADTLPDGWWYGFVRSPIRAGSSFEFDLACFYIGRIAAQTAHNEDPVNYPDPSFIDNDVYVSNSNEKARSVAVASTADLRCLDPGRAGFADQFPCASPGEMWAVWVRVQGGSATKVLEQFAP